MIPSRFLLLLAMASTSALACSTTMGEEDDSSGDEGALRQITDLGASAIATAVPLRLGAPAQTDLRSGQEHAIYKFSGRKGDAVHIVTKGPSDRVAQVVLLRPEGSGATFIQAARASDGELAADLPGDGDYFIAVRESKKRRASFTLLAAGVTPLGGDCSDGLPTRDAIAAATPSGQVPRVYATSAPARYVEGIGQSVQKESAAHLEQRSCHPATGCSAWTRPTEDSAPDDAGNFIGADFGVDGTKVAAKISIWQNGDSLRVPNSEQATRSAVDGTGWAGFAAKYQYLKKSPRDLTGGYATESLVTRARVGKTCAITAASKIALNDRGGYVELRTTSRIDLAAPFVAAPRVPSSDVPPEAASCAGERLNDATLRAKFAPGTAVVQLAPGTAVEQVRTCQELTGCSEWQKRPDAPSAGRIVIDASGELGYENGSFRAPITDGVLSIGEVRTGGVSLRWPTEKSNGPEATQRLEKSKAACEKFAD